MPPPLPHTLENKLYYVRMILLLTDLDFFEITTTQMVICKQPLVSLHSLARVERVCAIVNISHHHNSAAAAAGSSSSVGGDGDRSAINWSLQTVMLLLTMVAS